MRDEYYSEVTKLLHLEFDIFILFWEGGNEAILPGKLDAFLFSPLGISRYLPLPIYFSPILSCATQIN